MADKEGFHDPENTSQRDDALETIKEMLADHHPKKVIVAELVDQGVPQSSAYRWVSEQMATLQPKDTGASACFTYAEDAFLSIAANGDDKETLKAALSFAQVLKALGRS